MPEKGKIRMNMPQPVHMACRASSSATLGAVALRATRRSRPFLAFLVTSAATFIVAASLYDALCLPGDLGLLALPHTHGRREVRWVMPGGPAWISGVRPGDTLVHIASDHAIAVRRASGHRLVTRAAVLRPTAPDILDGTLGLVLLAVSAVVLVKAADRGGGWAFWRMCLCAGVTIGLVPATIHGRVWALIAQAVAVRLFGPALLALAFVLSGWHLFAHRWSVRSLALWLPALALLPLYAAVWAWPDHLSLVAALDRLVLGGYLVAACLVLVLSARRLPSRIGRTSWRWLACGLVGAVAPFVLWTLLPSAVSGRELLPADVTALALVLVPLGLATAIVRAEVFGISTLIRRRTLQVLSNILVLAGGLMIAHVLVTAGEGWGWPPAICLIGATVLAALGVALLGPPLFRSVANLVLRDAYDLDAALSWLRKVLAGVVTLDDLLAAEDAPISRLLLTLDASALWVVTPHVEWRLTHPRIAGMSQGNDRVGQRAQHLLTTASCGQPWIERVDGRAIRFYPIGDEGRMRAVLCLGPKRSGDGYGAQDRAVLALLIHHLTIVLRAQPADKAMDQPGVASTNACCPADANPDRSAAAALSGRERDVARLLADGLSNKDMAQRLGVTPKTIEAHLASIRKKWGVHNRTQAALEARRVLTHGPPAADPADAAWN